MTGEPINRAPRRRRPRTLTESLLSIVLALEAVLVFFVALTVYGLHALPPLAALGGGAALLVLIVFTTRIVRYRWGVWVGWVLQAALLATGTVLPVLYIAAGFFVAMWIFCFVRAREIDRTNSAQPTTPASNQTEGQAP